MRTVPAMLRTRSLRLPTTRRLVAPPSAFDLPNGPKRCGAQHSLTVAHHEHIAAANGLCSSARQHDGIGDELSGIRRGANVIDLEFGRDAIAQRRPTGVGQRIVREIGEHAAVHEPVLLQMLRLQREAQAGTTVFVCLNSGAHQHAEGLSRENLASVA